MHLEHRTIRDGKKARLDVISPVCDWGFLNLDEIQRWSHYLEIRLRGVAENDQFVMGVFSPTHSICVGREQKTMCSSTLVQCANEVFETTSGV